MGLAAPHLIALDAVGTLFGLRESVGTVYARFAAQAGVGVAADALNRSFFQAFQAAPPCTFPNLAAAERARAELEWWQAVAAETFARAGVLDQFQDFPAFFAPVFNYYATATPWQVYPEVLATLQAWQRRGIPLIVISNFDSRLYGVLERLGLAPLLSAVFISSEVGAAKPNPRIFAQAIAPFGLDPQQAWHIGDSWQDDVVGAQAAQWQPIWLRRSSPLLPQPDPAPPPTVVQISDLTALNAILGCNAASSPECL